jgi:hypothetical protein
MSLIVEDGSIVTGANTYASLSYVDTFCSDLGLASWAALGTTSRESAILRGMAYIESLSFKGVKSDADQPLKWPRDGVYDEDGYAIEDDAIPANLLRAVSRAAYEEGISPGATQPTRETGIKREKVDVIEVEYFTHSGNVTKAFEAINGYLAGLLKDGFTVNLVRA